MSVDFNLADFFKLPIKIIAAIAIGTGLILFLPEQIVDKLYLLGFRDKYGFILGLVFIITVAIVGVSLVILICNAIKSASNIRIFKKNAGKRIMALDDYQKTIVYALFDEINHTSELPLNDGGVRGLEQKLIIGKATNQYPVDISNPMFPYFLQPWVVEYLNQHSDIVEDFKLIAEHTVRKLEIDKCDNVTFFK